MTTLFKFDDKLRDYLLSVRHLAGPTVASFYVATAAAFIVADSEKFFIFELS